MNGVQELIDRCETLLQLYRLLRLGVVDSWEDVDMPVFGGEIPDDLTDVWSWDSTHLIVGTRAENLKRIEREDD